MTNGTNRRRGLGFQREVVYLASAGGLDAHVRDWCCTHSEKGDVEIGGLYFSCKRVKRLAKNLYPEKPDEVGVFIREDRHPALAVVPADWLFDLMGAACDLSVCGVRT